MVMQIIPKQLQIDRCSRSGESGKVSREEDESDVAHLFGSLEMGQMANFERRVAVRVAHLGGVLDAWQPTGVDELLLEGRARVKGRGVEADVSVRFRIAT